MLAITKNNRPKIRQRILITTQYGPAEFISFENLSDGRENIAVVFSGCDLTSPLVRLHSECLTGDVFGSERCDCGPQLQDSILQLAKQGGVLLYLRQEGRGIGLYNKLDAYGLQEMGFDTYEANKLLGYPDDMRNYQSAAEMLQALNLNTIKLITNNPDKINQIRKAGINISSIIPTGVFLTSENKAYLRAKAKYSQHTIRIEDQDD